MLPIGGLRQKLLAAHRGLIREVLVPRENEKDLKEVPEEILKDLTITLVDDMDQVLEKALLCDDSKAIFCGRDTMVPLTNQLLKDEYQGRMH